MIAPSGNGSFPSRYASIATSLPTMARRSLRSRVGHGDQPPVAVSLRDAGYEDRGTLPVVGLRRNILRLRFLSNDKVVRAEAIMIVRKWCFTFVYLFFCSKIADRRTHPHEATQIPGRSSRVGRSPAARRSPAGRTDPPGATRPLSRHDG
jgi:hypothetical protein